MLSAAAPSVTSTMKQPVTSQKQTKKTTSVQKQTTPTSTAVRTTVLTSSAYWTTITDEQTTTDDVTQMIDSESSASPTSSPNITFVEGMIRDIEK